MPVTVTYTCASSLVSLSLLVFFSTFLYLTYLQTSNSWTVMTGFFSCTSIIRRWEWDPKLGREGIELNCTFHSSHFWNKFSTKGIEWRRVPSWDVRRLVRWGGRFGRWEWKWEREREREPEARSSLFFPPRVDHDSSSFSCKLFLSSPTFFLFWRTDDG